jgi:hypothetical protein
MSLSPQDPRFAGFADQDGRSRCPASPTWRAEHAVEDDMLLMLGCMADACHSYVARRFLLDAAERVLAPFADIVCRAVGESRLWRGGVLTRETWRCLCAPRERCRVVGIRGR